MTLRAEHQEAGEFRRSSKRRLLPAWIGLAPLIAFTAIFLVWPTAGVLASAFSDGSGGVTGRHVAALLHDPYLDAFVTSVRLSALTAVLGGVLGLVTCYAALRPGSPGWLRSSVLTFSGVASQFGGVPIAFAFVSTLGTVGLVTRWLEYVGIDLYGYGFSLFSFAGLCVVYVYLQIPLMVLIVAPAVEGLRRDWREAVASLGGTTWHYWRDVGLPVLMPAVLSGTIVLFGHGFAAYASAYALTSGKVNLVPVLIGQVISGNVVVDEQLGYSLATGMIIVIVVAMSLYLLLERRTARWSR